MKQSLLKRTLLSLTLSRTLAIATVAALSMATATPASAQASNILLGLFPGTTSFDATRAWLGKTPSVQVMFTDFDTRSTAGAMSTLYRIWNSGSVPLLTWEVFTDINTRTAPSNINYLVARGDYDAYLRDYANRLRDYLDGPDGIYGNGDDRRLFMRFAHEMNGNWYPWSVNYNGANHTAGDYVNMWRRVHDLFRQAGLDNNHVQWMWIPMNCDCSATPLEQYYPGANYVDWVGVDGYNWGAVQSPWVWVQPEPLLRNFLDRVARLAPGKPLAIPEIGTTTSNGDKIQWMRDMGGFTSYYTGPNGSRVKLLAYFNIDKETDWAIFGGSLGRGNESYTYQGVTYRGYSTYREMMQWSNYIGSPGNHPRVINDAQFRGQF